MSNPATVSCRRNRWVKVASDEVILKPNSIWLLAITNKATSDNPINVNMSYEK